MGAGSSVSQERKSIVREHLEKKKEKRASTQDQFSDFTPPPSSPVNPTTQSHARMRLSPAPQAPGSSTSGTSGGSIGAKRGSSAASSPSALPTRASKATKQNQMANLDALIITEATAMATAGRDRVRGEGEGESLYAAAQSPSAKHAALTAQASAHWHRLLLHAREQRNLEQEQLAQPTPHGVRQLVDNADSRQYERVESASVSGDDEIIYTNNSVDDVDADDYGAYMHTRRQGRGGGVHGGGGSGGKGGGEGEGEGSSASPLAALHRGNSTNRPRREGSKHQRRFFVPKETSSDLASLAVGGGSSKMASGVGYSGSSYGTDYDYAGTYAGGEAEAGGRGSEKAALKVAGGLDALPPLELVLMSRTGCKIRQATV
jgi:hypothetical protein